MVDTVKNQVAQMIKDTTVLMYSKIYCPYYDEAKAILKKGNVYFVAQELDLISGGDKFKQN
jgi:glutaredoxin